MYCKYHAEDTMVDVANRRCAQKGCSKHRNFAMEGTNIPVYGKDHAEDGMVNVNSRRCAGDGCSKRPTFGAAGTKTPCTARITSRTAWAVGYGRMRVS